MHFKNTEKSVDISEWLQGSPGHNLEWVKIIFLSNIKQNWI